MNKRRIKNLLTKRIILYQRKTGNNHKQYIHIPTIILYGIGFFRLEKSIRAIGTMCHEFIVN